MYHSMINLHKLTKKRLFTEKLKLKSHNREKSKRIRFC